MNYSPRMPSIGLLAALLLWIAIVFIIAMLSGCSLLSDRQMLLLRQQTSDIKAAARATQTKPEIAPQTLQAMIDIANQMDNQLCSDGTPPPLPRVSKSDWTLDPIGSLEQTRDNIKVDNKEWESASILGIGAILIAALGALLRYGKYIPGPVGNVMTVFDGMIGGSDPKKTKLLGSLHGALETFKHKQPDSPLWQHLSKDLSDEDKVTVRKMRKK